MDVRSAEFTKYAANAMLATKIRFMNELANIAERVGVDIESVRIGIGSDPRIGYSFIYPGCGYGGSLLSQGRALAGADRGRRRLRRPAPARGRGRSTTARSRCSSPRSATTSTATWPASRFAVWGLAFKPNTDDMRDAPSRDADGGALGGRRAGCVAFDPEAMDEARRLYPDRGRRRPTCAWSSTRRRRSTGSRRAGDLHRVAGIPGPGLRGAQGAAARSRSSSTAATSTTRSGWRGRASPTSGSASASCRSR